MLSLIYTARFSIFNNYFTATICTLAVCVLLFLCSCNSEDPPADATAGTGGTKAVTTDIGTGGQGNGGTSGNNTDRAGQGGIPSVVTEEGGTSPNDTGQGGTPSPDAGPVEHCGNGIIDQDEQCEKEDLGGATCETLSLGTGTLSCTESCTFNTEMCDGDGGGGEAGYGGSGEGGTGGATTNTGGGDIPADHCLANIDSYNSNGPFTYRTTRLGRTNAYIPDVPTGCKVPMIHYSNGTGAMCAIYSAILTRLASNGFIALCYENTNTGAGRYGIESYKAALAEYPDLADFRFGSTGHSQGGMAAFNTTALAEDEWGDQGIYSALPMEPASGFGANPPEGWQRLYASINSPVFMFSGLVTDTLVSQGWVQMGFNALDDSTEAYFYAKSGANHITTISRDGSEVVVSWFRWTLLGDTKACEYFKAIPDNVSGWSLIDSQNERPCN